MYAARSIFAKSDVGDDVGERRAVGAPTRGAKHLKLKGAYYMYISFATGIKNTNAELSRVTRVLQSSAFGHAIRLH
jgi:hypothetical protein